MKVDITFDNNYFVISSDYIFELNVIRRAFTREIPNAWMLKKITDIQITDREFMNKYNMISTNLWLEIIKVAKKFNIAMEMTPAAQNFLNQFTLKFEDFKSYIDDIFEGAENEEGKEFKPYDYQVKAAYTLLKYKKCCGEISTSGGKTLISFMIFKYLIDTQGIDNILYIVPSVDLANQSAVQYERYESYLKKHNHNWEIGILRSGLTKKQKAKVESCNILFGTFQSLCKRKKEFFDRFGGCICDECCHPDTLITMADGNKKKISDVVKGDKVFTYNEETKQKEIHEVDYVYKNLSSHEVIYELEKEDGTFIKLTGNHKVLTKNRGYVRVDDLNVDDEILNLEFSIHIKNIKVLEYKGDVYNLRIKSDNDLNHNYYANDLCISNCHHLGNAASIKNILYNMSNLKYSIGVTGTFPKETMYENLYIQSVVGPVVYKLTADQLINTEKRGTPIYAVIQYLKWADQQTKETMYIYRANKNPMDITAGSKVLKIERKTVNESYTRLKYICDQVINTKKNALVLFGDIKYGYGKKVYDYIKDNSSKDVYYTDGNTPNKTRDYYKQCMEEDTSGNTVIVASINTFGEGIDIKNLWSIFLVDTAKSERLVRQICGRGIRLYPGKDKVVIFDFVDDIRYSADPNKRYKDNYLWRHGQERKKIYLEQHFPVYEQKVNFS